MCRLRYEFPHQSIWPDNLLQHSLIWSRVISLRLYIFTNCCAFRVRCANFLTTLASLSPPPPGSVCACFCFLGEEKQGCWEGNYSDYTLAGGGANLQCEACEIPAELVGVDFYWTYGTDDATGLFSSCNTNLCSDREASVCGPGEVLEVGLRCTSLPSLLTSQHLQSQPRTSCVCVMFAALRHPR